MPSEPMCLNERGAANLLGVSAKTVQRWRRAGLIPCAKVGGTYLYPEELLREHILNAARANRKESEARS